jgi:hypothetical protein
MNRDIGGTSHRRFLPVPQARYFQYISWHGKRVGRKLEMLGVGYNGEGRFSKWLALSKKCCQIPQVKKSILESLLLTIS